MFKEIIATCLLSGSIGAKTITPIVTPIIDTKRAISFVNSPSLIQGVYNYRDTIDYDAFMEYVTENDYVDDYDRTFVLDNEPPQENAMPYKRWAIPVSYNNYTYYLYQIRFYYSIYDELGIIFYVYDNGYESYSTFSWNVYSNTLLSDDNETTWQREFMINFRDQISFDTIANRIFDCFFTTEENEYITTYSGYISFFNTINYSAPFTAFGTEIIDTSMYRDLMTQVNGAVLRTYLSVAVANYYTYDFSFYENRSINMPLQSYNRSWLVGNYKMSKTSKSNLEYIAFFGYVNQHTYANVTFKDFFFSLVDTPVYFATSLLSFDLFGVNLFVALTGLLTLCCILMLIKKFW